LKYCGGWRLANLGERIGKHREKSLEKEILSGNRQTLKPLGSDQTWKKSEKATEERRTIGESSKRKKFGEGSLEAGFAQGDFSSKKTKKKPRDASRRGRKGPRRKKGTSEKDVRIKNTELLRLKHAGKD